MLLYYTSMVLMLIRRTEMVTLR